MRPSRCLPSHSWVPADPKGGSCARIAGGLLQPELPQDRIQGGRVHALHRHTSSRPHRYAVPTHRVDAAAKSITTTSRMKYDTLKSSFFQRHGSHALINVFCLSVIAIIKMCLQLGAH